LRQSHDRLISSFSKYMQQSPIISQPLSCMWD
jgi:hypothetical protein